MEHISIEMLKENAQAEKILFDVGTDKILETIFLDDRFPRRSMCKELYQLSFENYCPIPLDVIN